MFRIEHTAYRAFVNPKAARQFGVTDLLMTHGQVECKFWREPKRHRIR